MSIRLILRTLTPWLLIAAAGGLAAAIRFLFIEPAAMGETCEAHAALWWCSLRLMLVKGFLYNIYGWAAAVLAITSLATRRPWLAVLAAALGVFAMVLYCVELGAFALLVGVLREARLRADGSPFDENSRGQQHIHAAP